MGKVLDVKLETALWDALVNSRCESIADIEAATGWTNRKVRDVLLQKRKDATNGDSWWTVPHTQNGSGRHLYIAVDAKSGVALTAEDNRLVLLGEISNLQKVQQQANNGAAAFKVVAQHVSPALAKKCQSQARVMEVAGDLAGNVIDELRAMLVTP